MLSVKCVFLIWQETNGGIVILKTVLKSDVWPGSEKCGFNPKLEDNDLKSGCYRVPKLPPLSVNYVCPISHKTNHPIMIPKIVLKSVLWRGSESALNCCIFQLLCFSLHPNIHLSLAHSMDQFGTITENTRMAKITFWANLILKWLNFANTDGKMLSLYSQISRGHGRGSKCRFMQTLCPIYPHWHLSHITGIFHKPFLFTSPS